MARRPSITSIHNERLKAVRRLRRGRSDVFVVEGHRQLSCALDAGVRVRELYVAPDLFLGDRDAALVRRAEELGARVVELAPVAFASISRGTRPDGLAAVVGRWPTPLARLEAGSLLLVADGIERPGNLGVLIRTACAAGVDGVIVCDGSTDVFHPETVRGSVGTIFHVPIARATGGEALAWLRKHDVRIVVATPSGRMLHVDADYPPPTAIVVGSERHGVGPAWLDAADETVRIALPGAADSLNVAVAAGIVLFEALRPR